MNDRLKWRMWSTNAGRYFDETNDAMLENVFECMKQQICYDCQNPVFRKIYDRIAYNHIADGMVFEQCTGLKDKNGNLIYEGDICIPAEDMADKAGEVYRAESGAYFIKGRMKNGMEYDFGIYWHHYMYEVIGNIHENGDLLK